MELQQLLWEAYSSNAGGVFKDPNLERQACFEDHHLKAGQVRKGGPPCLSRIWLPGSQPASKLVLGHQHCLDSLGSRCRRGWGDNQQSCCTSGRLPCQADLALPSSSLPLPTAALAQGPRLVEPEQASRAMAGHPMASQKRPWSSCGWEAAYGKTWVTNSQHRSEKAPRPCLGQG